MEGTTSEQTRYEATEFNHHFTKGESVTLNTRMVAHFSLKDYQPYLGKIGTVEAVYSNLHAFGRGSVYQHDVRFVNGLLEGVFHPMLDSLQYVPGPERVVAWEAAVAEYYPTYQAEVRVEGTQVINPKWGAYYAKGDLRDTILATEVPLILEATMRTMLAYMSGTLVKDEADTTYFCETLVQAFIPLIGILSASVTLENAQIIIAKYPHFVANCFSHVADSNGHIRDFLLPGAELELKEFPTSQEIRHRYVQLVQDRIEQGNLPRLCDPSLFYERSELPPTEELTALWEQVASAYFPVRLLRTLDADPTERLRYGLIRRKPDTSAFLASKGPEILTAWVDFTKFWWEQPDTGGFLHAGALCGPRFTLPGA
jgi:hypothetical protein